MTEENRFEAIKKAVEQRDAFLAENPEYQWLQNDINELLGKAGSQHNRNAILAQMMRQKLYELELALKELSSALSS